MRPCAIMGPMPRLQPDPPKGRGRVDPIRAALERLADAQVETQAEIRALAEAQRRTEERLEQLAEAQRRADDRITRLEAAVERLAREVGRLSETIGFSLEDLARDVTPDRLARRHGIQVNASWTAPSSSWTARRLKSICTGPGTATVSPWPSSAR